MGPVSQDWRFPPIGSLLVSQLLGILVVGFHFLEAGTTPFIHTYAQAFQTMITIACEGAPYTGGVVVVKLYAT